jgi:DNA polymerase IV
MAEVRLQDETHSDSRKILHIDMDAFYVEVELLKQPHLRGKPVIVGCRPPRGVVSTSSYEARKFGVHSGMASVVADRLCPEAIWLGGDFEAYSYYSRCFIDILKRYSPQVVQLSIDEARIDLTGSELLFGSATDIAHTILGQIRQELGLPASGGLANSGTVAKIAAELAKPKGLTVILPGYEKSFLAPLKVERIPGVGRKSLPRFHRYGVYRIGDIARKPARELTQLFGRWAGSLQKIALGMPGSANRGQSDSSSRSHEKTFPEDILDPVIIRAEIRRLVERLGFRLRREGLRVKTLSVKIRDGRFNTITRAITMDTPANSDRILFQTAVDLVFQNLPASSGIRLLGVSAQNVTSEIRQLTLFPSSDSRLSSFYQTVDGIKMRFGQTAVRFGQPGQRSKGKPFIRYSRSQQKGT